MHKKSARFCQIYLTFIVHFATPQKMRYNARHWKFFRGYISVYPRPKTFNLGKIRPSVELFCVLLQSVPQTATNHTKTPLFCFQKLPKQRGFIQCYTSKPREKFRFRPILAGFGVIRWFWAIPQNLRLFARGWISLFRWLLPAPAQLAPFSCVLWRSVRLPGRSMVYPVFVPAPLPRRIWGSICAPAPCAAPDPVHASPAARPILCRWSDPSPVTWSRRHSFSRSRSHPSRASYTDLQLFTIRFRSAVPCPMG